MRFYRHFGFGFGLVSVLANMAATVKFVTTLHPLVRPSHDLRKVAAATSANSAQRARQFAQRLMRHTGGADFGTQRLALGGA